MARGVLAQLGEPAVGLLQADRDNIWFRSEAMEIDLDRQERALRAALAMGPGQDRDDRLVPPYRTSAPFSPTHPTSSGRCAAVTDLKSCANRRA